MISQTYFNSKTYTFLLATRLATTYHFSFMHFEFLSFFFMGIQNKKLLFMDPTSKYIHTAYTFETPLVKHSTKLIDVSSQEKKIKNKPKHSEHPCKRLGKMYWNKTHAKGSFNFLKHRLPNFERQPTIPEKTKQDKVAFRNFSAAAMAFSYCTFSLL